VGSKIRIFSATECVSAVRGHPKSMILLPIESAYATSYFFPIVTMVQSCTVSEIRRLINVSKLHRPPISDAFLADTVYTTVDYNRVVHLRFCCILCIARSLSQPRRHAQL